VDTAAVAAYGRRESFLSVTDIRTVDGAARESFAALGRTGTPDDVIEVGHFAYSTAGESVGTAFTIGDRVETVTEDGTTIAPYRVRGWSASEPVPGQLLVDIDLNTMRREKIRELDRWLSRAANGTLGGRSNSATPGSPSIVESGEIRGAEWTWSQSGDSVAETAPPDIGKWPTKILSLHIVADEFGAGSGPTVWRLYRDGVHVATLTLPAADLSADLCLTTGLYGVQGTKWSARVHSAGGRHRNTTFKVTGINIS
jgi:hypothetical protein